MKHQVVLHAENTSKTYRAPHGLGVVRALIDVSVEVTQGRTLGIVGESGSGKTTLTRLLLGLESPTEGTVRYQTRDIALMGDTERADYRRRVAAVFQNPYSSLDPRMRIWDVITEQQAIEKSASKAERRARALELLEVVGLPSVAVDRYPHQLSGGQRQRVAIARALAQKPEVIILDEPLSALDVSVSAQIVNLLIDLQEQFGVTYLFVGHDLRLVRHLCHEVAVMYRGRVVEQGSAESVLGDPQHPYSQALVTASDLSALSEASDDDSVVASEVTDEGCAFKARCRSAQSCCAEVAPELRTINGADWVRCHFPKSERLPVG